MLSLIMSILFPCFSLLLLQISFIPAFFLLLTTAVLGSIFVGQRLTVQKREYYVIRKDENQAYLTERGIRKVEKILALENHQIHIIDASTGGISKTKNIPILSMLLWKQRKVFPSAAAR